MEMFSRPATSSTRPCLACSPRCVNQRRGNTKALPTSQVTNASRIPPVDPQGGNLLSGLLEARNVPSVMVRTRGTGWAGTLAGDPRNFQAPTLRLPVPTSPQIIWWMFQAENGLEMMNHSEQGVATCSGRVEMFIHESWTPGRCKMPHFWHPPDCALDQGRSL